ncbi:porin family protein [Mesonia aquimarina]|uniref:porin family protein n=1 Tax=Mesonia aquimarina TaxID=1504967 RepID=UPI000EF60717|nr:porin family protein [Mesonia aquimarina]
MKKLLFFTLFFLFAALPVIAQIEQETEQDSIVVGETKIDSLYREDQFYLGLSFNLITNTPTGVDQSGFSGGLHAGFIRDMPINKARNIAFGAGLGWSVNTYGLNLMISEDPEGNSIFEPIDGDIDYDTNRYTTYLVEVPLQFRWRTSNPTSHKFWRIYAGVRMGYIYYFKSNFKNGNVQIKQTKVPELNRWRTGLAFTFGYNTFNFHVYYSLNSFFDGKITGTQDDIGLNTFKLGFMFYIL